MGTGYCHGCMERISAYPCPKCGYTPAHHTSPYALPPGTVLNGKYLVGRVLGQGGFGITYIGLDLQLQCKVAIKEYYPAGFVARKTGSSQVVWYSSEAAQQARSSGQELVLKEARKISKLSDIEPVVQVFNVFQENGTAYICMDFIEGHTLQYYLKHKGTLTWEQTKAVFLPIINTMDQIHKLGLIHRDLSPDNLMIQPNGLIKILDLGAAKDLNLNSGKSSMQVAKNGFSPLEQYMHSGNSGPWTDVYAMAATMYYTLTGQIPAVAIDRMDNDTLSWDLPPLQALPLPVLKAMQHALAVRASERTQSMEAFARELQGTVTTKEPPRKRLIAIIAAAVIGVAAITGAAIGLSGQKPKPSGPSAGKPGSSTSAGKNNSSEPAPASELLARIDELIGTCTREVYNYRSGSRMELYFNDQDQECVRIFIDEDGHEQYTFLAEYDSNGNILELHGLEGNVKMRSMVWLRNSSGNATSRMEWDQDSNLVERLAINYDAQDREIGRSRHSGDGSLLFEGTSTYDDKGIRTYSGQYDDGESFVYTYDAQGNQVSSITTGPDGKLISRSVYEYDAQGNRTESTSYDANDIQTNHTVYYYDGDLQTGRSTRSFSNGEEYIYEYKYIFGPRNIQMGDSCTGSYSSDYEYVEDMMGYWMLRSYNHYPDSDDENIHHYNWNGDNIFSEEFDASGNLVYYSETLFDESGKETGSKSIWYDEDGNYDITLFDTEFRILYTENYDSHDTLLDRTDYQYDSDGNKLGSTRTEYSADGSYTVSERNANYNVLVSRTYDSAGTLLSMVENSYDSSNQKTGSVLTTYYYDGSYTVVVKDAQYKIISEKTYDAAGNLIKSS